MAARVEAMVTPALLEWARKRAGYEIDAAAEKAKVKPDDLIAWEQSGATHPSLPQLRRLAAVYKRPIAVFYLPTPPKDFQPLEDFRRAPDSGHDHFSPQLLYEMRRAQERREIALELYEGLGEQWPDFDVTATADESPEEVGTRLRSTLGVDHEEQIAWAAGHASLHAWRAAVEQAGVLVFQSKGVPEGEMRGFSLSQRPLPAIVLNGREAPAGRIFTLAHELTHIALRSAAVCDLDEASGDVAAARAPSAPGVRTSVERFCNAVAAAMLMSEKDLLADPMVASHRGMEWSTEQVSSLATRYGVSREALLLRLLTLRRTSETFYWAKRRDFMNQHKARPKPKGGPAVHVTAVARAGGLFTRLVINSYHQHIITAADVSEYLAVGVPHLPKVEGELHRGGIAA